MAVNARQYLTITHYKRGTAPASPQSQTAFNQREWMRMQQTISDLTEASGQATDEAPVNPRIGTQRYATGAWATTLGAEGLYVYKSTGWTKIV